jgi:hypothetical protein
MPLLTMDQNQFSLNYNKRPFFVRHDLAHHPLTQIEALRLLADRLAPAAVLYRVRAVVTDDFDAAKSAHPTSATAAHVFDHLHESGTSVQITAPETDPEYRPLVEELLADIRQHTEAIDPTMTYTRAYFFVAGPDCVTPYHMDREMNFLLHIRGPKQLSLWDPSDREVMGEQDRELLFSEWARPAYRPSFAAKAMRFDLQPGIGVHHPFIAPHTARTGGDLSISLAVTYRTRGSDRVSLLHKVNGRLRRLGLHPKPVGIDPRVDAIKAVAGGAIRHLRSISPSSGRRTGDR